MFFTQLAHQSCVFNRNQPFDYVVGMQDTHPLEPAEMAEHLKQGLGKEGQVYALYTFLFFSNSAVCNFLIMVLLRKTIVFFITEVCVCRLYISKRYHLERHHLQNFLVIFQKLWEKHWLVLEYLDCTVTRYPIFCAYLVVEDHLFCVDFLLECSLKP